MGVQNFASRTDYNLTIQTLGIWTQRADVAILNTEVPWNTII